MSEKKLTRQEKREKQIEQIQMMMEENGGILKTSQLYTLGMDYRRIQTFVNDGIIERVKNGYYSMNYHKKREEDIIAVLYSDCVLTMESALYFHHYLKNRPFKWTIAVDKNTSKSRFKMDYPLVLPYYTEPEVLQMGTMKISIGSSEMSVYCKERLICDILKYENRMERDDLQQALRSFIMDKEKDIAKLLEYAKRKKSIIKSQESGRGVVIMSNQLLNDKFIRQRSEELQIPYENLFVASVLEEIVQKISNSDYAQNFWMKNSENLNLENYRKKVDLSLSFYIKDSNQFHYKKADIGKLFAELFRNYKKEAIYWNYHITTDLNKIYIDVVATLSSLKVPVKIKLEPVTQENLTAYSKDIQLFSNNNQKIKIYCYPSEYVITEKFLEIIKKLELLNDMSCYLAIYEILKKDILSGRRVWELLQEGCTKEKIAIDEKRFQLLLSYRTSKYMEKKWKACLRHEKRKQPQWNAVLDVMEQFFGVIWDHMCRNVVYLGDWMPELGRYIDS